MSWPWIQTENHPQTKSIADRGVYYSNDSVIAYKTQQYQVVYDPNLPYLVGREYEARCFRRQFIAFIPGIPQEHRSPLLECTCGLYAWKSLADAVDPYHNVLEVELSGRVIEHERGYRAERMRVLSIYLNDRHVRVHLHEGPHSKQVFSIPMDRLDRPIVVPDWNMSEGAPEFGEFSTSTYVGRPRASCSAPGECFVFVTKEG